MSSAGARGAKEHEGPTKATASTVSLLDVFKHTKPRFASSQARRRYEMDTLRQQVRDLRAILERARPQGAAQMPMGREHEELLGAATGWKQVALKEHGQLKHALRVNEQLRRRLLDYGKLAKTIKAMVARNAAVQTVELAPDDLALLREAHADLEEMQRRAGPTIEMLLHHRVTSSELQRKWRIRFDMSGPAIEVLASYEVPFRKSEVERAMQRLLLQEKPNQRLLPAHLFGASSDTVSQLLLLTYRLAGDGIAQRIHFTCSTAVGESHTTAVHSALITFKTPNGAAPETNSVVRYQSWTVLTPVVHVDPLTQQEQHSTLVRTLSRVSPVALDTTVAHLWGKEVVESAVIPAWDQEISASTQQLENLLLEHQHAAA